MVEMIATLEYPYDDYEVYSSGKVYSNKRNKFLKPYPDRRNGYMMVRLYDKKGLRVDRSLARLVAEIFVTPPSSMHSEVVIHKNYDITDCRAENLEWRSRGYARHYKDQIKVRDLYNKPTTRVRRYFPRENTLPQPYGTLAQAAEDYGLLYTEVFNTAAKNVPVYTVPNLGFTLDY